MIHSSMEVTDLSWELVNDRPIWVQLIEQLTRRIVSGEYPPGARVPSVRDLAAEAGVNPNTMQRALSGLEERGLLVAQRSIGRFVTQDAALIVRMRQELAEQELAVFKRRMRLLGYQDQEILEFVSAKGEKA
jgi:GntR family transcriptional regulator